MKSNDLKQAVRDLQTAPKLRVAVSGGDMYLALQKGSLVEEIGRLWPSKHTETALTFDSDGYLKRDE